MVNDTSKTRLIFGGKLFRREVSQITSALSRQLYHRMRLADQYSAKPTHHGGMPRYFTSDARASCFEVSTSKERLHLSLLQHTTAASEALSQMCNHGANPLPKKIIHARATGMLPLRNR